MKHLYGADDIRGAVWGG